jgi:hypothetical protein
VFLLFLPRYQILLAHLPALLPASLLALHYQSQTRRTEMPLIQAPSVEPKKVKVTHRLDEPLLYKVRRYAEFIRAKNDYVITEALNYFFDQDSDFAEWLAAHPAPSATARRREKAKPTSSFSDRTRPIPSKSKPDGTAAALSAPGESVSAGSTI